MSSTEELALPLRVVADAVPVGPARHGINGVEAMLIAVLDLSDHPDLVIGARTTLSAAEMVLARVVELRDAILAEADRQLGPPTTRSTTRHPSAGSLVAADGARVRVKASRSGGVRL